MFALNISQVDFFSQAFSKIRKRTLQLAHSRFQLGDSVVFVGDRRGSLCNMGFFSYRVNFADKQVGVLMILAPGFTR